MSTPLVYGNFDIARRFKSGRMFLAIHGDSIYNAPSPSYLRRMMRYTNGIIGHLSVSISSVADTAWFTNGGAYAGSGDTRPWICSISGGGFGKIVNGIGTSGTDSSINALAPTYGVAQCDEPPAYSSYGFRDQTWYQNKALTYGALWYNEADGWPTFGMRCTTSYARADYGTNAALSAAGTAGTFSSSTKDVASQTYTGAIGWVPRVQIVGTASTDYTGKKLRLVGGKIVRTDRLTSGNGLALLLMTTGGTKMQDWASLTNWDQYSRTALYTFMGIDTVWIAFGQNDNARTKAQFKADAAAMADACRAANPDMNVIFLSPYQSDNTLYFTGAGGGMTREQSAEALYEVTAERSGWCLLLNLGGALAQGTTTAEEAYQIMKGTGPDANMASNISDTVHPSAGGMSALGAAIAGLIDLAAGMGVRTVSTSSRFSRLRPLLSDI